MHALRRHIADGVAVLVPGGPAEFASRIGTPFGAARMVAETARPKIA